MKPTMQKIIRLFRDKAVCEKCKSYAPICIPDHRHARDGCFMYHWMTFNTETKEEGEYWTPMWEVNKDGRCHVYEKKRVVSHGENHCIYCFHKDKAFDVNVCNAFDIRAWISGKYIRCSRKNKYSKCRQYREKEIRV